MLLLDPAPHDPRPLRLARGPPARRATPAVSGSPTGLTPAGRVAPSCRPQGSCQREGCPRPGWPQEDRREPPTPVGTAWPWLEAPNGRSAGPGPEARHRRTTCCSEMGSAPRPHPGLHVGTPVLGTHGARGHTPRPGVQERSLLGTAGDWAAALVPGGRAPLGSAVALAPRGGARCRRGHRRALAALAGQELRGSRAPGCSASSLHAPRGRRRELSWVSRASGAHEAVFSHRLSLNSQSHILRF